MSVTTARRRDTKKKAKCLTCEREARSRGLCNVCGMAARRELARIKGKAERATAEASLIAQGLMLPRRLPGPQGNPWTKRLEQIRSAQG